MRKWTIYLYQDDFENLSSIFGMFCKISSYSNKSVSWDIRWSSKGRTKLISFTSRDLRFDSTINLSKPCPLISLVGLISKSNPWIFAIHFPIFPSQSCYPKISFTVECGTKAIILECNT
jgi:hypothetical protein